MRIGVYGLWHLGLVTACALAKKEMRVLAVDEEEERIAALLTQNIPVQEPGLPELFAQVRTNGSLQLSSDITSLAAVDILWITIDTPLDDHDHADTEQLEARIQSVLRVLAPQTLVLISSQVPVGFTIRQQEQCARDDLFFAYLPENLRLGSALEDFEHPARIVAGTANEPTKQRLADFLSSFHAPIEWMRTESAEMLKHSLNSYLATSIAFINEIARVCENVGADALEVERGLRSDPRIGPNAYVRPGAPFSGGTLARDIQFLCGVAESLQLDLPLLQHVMISNSRAEEWIWHTLESHFGTVEGKNIAIVGLAYKAQTEIMRRSYGVTLASALSRAGAHVRAWDSRVSTLPEEIRAHVPLLSNPTELCHQLDALILFKTPEQSAALIAALQTSKAPLLVIDQHRCLESALLPLPHVTYRAVGVTFEDGFGSAQKKVA